VNQRQRKRATHAHATKLPGNVRSIIPKRNGSSIRPILKLRRLITELIKEVESLDENSLSPSETRVSKNGDGINFYDEVARFEVALIKRALRRSNGHQLLAARLLNLNPSTLHAKIKQYGLRPPV